MCTLLIGKYDEKIGLVSIIVMWFSRQRKFRADAGAAKLTNNKKMIAALERLQAQRAPSALPKQMSAFGIAGDRMSGFKKLFSSHPELSERIAALRSSM